MGSLEQYWKILTVVTEENLQLINLLLDKIVREEYVSSVEEFARLMGITYKHSKDEDGRLFGLLKYLIQPEANKQESTENDPFKCQLKQKRRKEAKKRHGQIFQSDFKMKLEAILEKYQNRSSQKEFL